MIRLFYLVLAVLVGALALGAHSAHLEPAAIVLGCIAALALARGLLAGAKKSRRLRHNPDAAWRRDPATAKQKDFAKELGIKLHRGMTKGELSDLIERAKNELG